MNRLTFYLAILLHLVGGTAAGEILPFRTYSVKDGLLSNNIEAIAQDWRGFMWFGTTDGISVFDGRTFTGYTIHDGLPSNFVTQILSDRMDEGTMWILAGGQLCKFSGGRFTTVRIDAGGLYTIYQDVYGVIWCGTDRGAFVIDGNVVTAFHPSLLQKGVSQIAEIGDSVIWFAGDASLTRFTRLTRRFQEIDIPDNDRFRSMLADKQGNLWVTHGVGGVLLIRGGEIVAHRPGRDDGKPTLKGFLYDVGGDYLWTYAYGGLSRTLKSGFLLAPIIRYTTENGLPENTLRSVLIDREGNLWLGGRDHGVARLSSWNVLRFPLGSVWFVHHHQFAAVDSNNHLWVIAAETLTEFWKDRYNAWHRHEHGIARPEALIVPDEGGDRKFSALVCDREGRLWVSTLACPGIIECYEIQRDPSPAGDKHSKLKRIRTVQVGNEFADRQTAIFCFVVSRNGDLWVSLSQVGIIHLDPKRKVPLVHHYAEAGLRNYVRTLYEDRDGNIWAGTFNSGLFRLSADSLSTAAFRRVPMLEGLPGSAIWDVRENPLGEKLIGTSNGGLAVLNDDGVRVMDMKDGLPSNKIFSMTLDSFGRLWLATSIGMVFEDAPGSGRFLKKQPFIGTAALCCGTTADGLLWFVTSTELVVYDHERDVTTTPFPPVYITHLKVNGNPHEAEYETRLAYDQNNCEISFIGVSFRDEEAIKYIYRLQGADAEWRGPTGNTSVTYGHLEPGSYRFEVKAVSIDGTTSVIPAVLAITIAPPFWRNRLFYGTASLVCIAGIAGLYRRRIKKARLQELDRQAATRLLLDSQEAERRRVAGELHDGLGQDLMVIINRAKMAMKSPTLRTAGPHLQEVTDTAAHAIEQVREIAFNLIPYHLEHLGLVESVKTMVEKVAGTSGTRITVNADGFPEIKNGELSLSIYRIVQECVNNVVKHAQATQAQIALTSRNNRLVITVHDDGRGFQAVTAGPGARARGGFGLRGLSERVELLRGSVSVDSSPGKGTTVTVTIPLPGAARMDQAQEGE